MIAPLRARFNRDWTPARYAALLEGCERAAGARAAFRHSETPCFFPRALLAAMAQAGRELVEQLLSHPRYLEASRAIIPAEFRVPGEAAYPLFVQADFGVVRNAAGELEPRLVEIQGFPSLYGYQPVLARQYLETSELDGLRYLLNGLEEREYKRILERAILGGHDPEQVVLMEIDPGHQKTLPDFTATEKLLGIPFVCITRIRREGRRLFYESAGRRIPIRRIYNRVIFDELVRRAIAAPFDWRDDLDVEWAGHPNWFFRLSKFSIPWFHHWSVPASKLLSDVGELPADPVGLVLKPLFSFAGLGVVVGPTREQIESIPPGERGHYILQERMAFEPVIETPYGLTQAEVRIMYVWLDELTPVNTIVRMGRGKMMGVDHNRNLEWVGASAGLYPAA